MFVNIKMKKFKTAFITFFPIVPDNMGSSAVINSRYKNWPNNNTNNKYGTDNIVALCKIVLFFGW